MYLWVTYDLTRTKARNQVVDVLESYGYRVQKSVFEIEITESDFIKLKMKLEKILKKAEIYYQENNMESNDSVKFYILCKTGECNVEGRIDGVGEWYQKISFPEVMIL